MGLGWYSTAICHLFHKVRGSKKSVANSWIDYMTCLSKSCTSCDKSSTLQVLYKYISENSCSAMSFFYFSLNIKISSNPPHVHLCFCQVLTWMYVVEMLLSMWSFQKAGIGQSDVHRVVFCRFPLSFYHSVCLHSLLASEFLYHISIMWIYVKQLLHFSPVWFSSRWKPDT